MKALPIALLAVSASFSLPALGQYSTGFETPPFNSGAIYGQDFWTATSTATTNSARVLTASEIATELTGLGLDSSNPVHGGSRALYVSSSTLGSSSTFRPVGGLAAANNVSLDVWARPLTGPTMGNIFLTMEDSGGNRAAAFRFGTSFGNSIDYGTTVAGIWQSSGVIWDANSWYRLGMVADYTTKTYDFSINGTVIANSIPFYTGTSTNFTQVRVFRGGNQAGMIVDDLNIVAVPEPGTWAFLAMGAGAFFCRKRIFGRV